MTPDRLLRRAREIFETIVDAEESERQAFLDAATEGDPQLRAEVTGLFESHAVSAGFLNLGSRVSLDSDAAAPSSPSRLGDLIGPYLLGEKLGEGGFGEVFQAEQLHPIRRTVAIKIMRIPLISVRARQHYQLERDALARLEHVNIARILDTGVAGDHRPYFVMEVVIGPIITTYCDQTRRSVRERVAVLLQAALGVQHAHQRGIIHRDIKPSNILVMEQDGQPIAKVIDFGVASLALGRAGAGSDPLGGRGGTPAFMSPEQFPNATISVDSRTDIYSLGAVLYQLVTGEGPYPAPQTDTGLVDLGGRLRVSTIEHASQRVLRPSGGDDGVASLRGCRTRQALARSIGAELDAILAKCLAIDPRDRYQSVGELIDDLRRYLRGLPVDAVGNGAAYRVRKFVSRHRVPVVAAILVECSVVIGGLGTGIGLLRAVEQRNIAEKAAAEQEQLKRVAQRETAIEMAARQEAEEAIERAGLLRGLVQWATLAPVDGESAADLTRILRSVAALVHERYGEDPRREVQVRIALAEQFTLIGALSDAWAECEVAGEAIVDSKLGGMLVIDAAQVAMIVNRGVGTPVMDSMFWLELLRREAPATLEPIDPKVGAAARALLDSLASPDPLEPARLATLTEEFEREADRLSGRIPASVAGSLAAAALEGWSLRMNEPSERELGPAVLGFFDWSVEIARRQGASADRIAALELEAQWVANESGHPQQSAGRASRLVELADGLPRGAWQQSLARFAAGQALIRYGRASHDAACEARGDELLVGALDAVRNDRSAFAGNLVRMAVHVIGLHRNDRSKDLAARAFALESPATLQALLDLPPLDAGWARCMSVEQLASLLATIREDVAAGHRPSGFVTAFMVPELERLIFYRSMDSSAMAQARELLEILLRADDGPGPLPPTVRVRALEAKILIARRQGDAIAAERAAVEMESLMGDTLATITRESRVLRAVLSNAQLAVRATNAVPTEFLRFLDERLDAGSFGLKAATVAWSIDQRCLLAGDWKLAEVTIDRVLGVLRQHPASTLPESTSLILQSAAYLPAPTDRLIETALEAADAWVRHDPQEGGARIAYALLLERVGRTDEASAQMDAAERIQATGDETMPYRRQAIALGRLLCAIRSGDRARFEKALLTYREQTPTGKSAGPIGSIREAYLSRRGLPNLNGPVS